jgi:hypothetical protein
VGNYEDACRILKQAQLQNPNDPIVLAALAQAYASLAVVDVLDRFGRTQRPQTPPIEQVIGTGGPDTPEFAGHVSKVVDPRTTESGQRAD